MRILFVAPSDSIHTARWINQISGFHEVFLFPSYDTGSSHSSLTNVTVFQTIYSTTDNQGLNVECKGIKSPSSYFTKFKLTHHIKATINILIALVKKLIKLVFPNYYIRYLEKVVLDVKPDIIHTLEIQSSGHMIDVVKSRRLEEFPKWIVSNWGSDIYYFGKKKVYETKIRSVLSHCDYYICECKRDVGLAKKYGLVGKVLGIIPSAGGYVFSKNRNILTKTSRRKAIMIKGYQGWSGRALIAIKAIDRLGELISSNKIEIYLYSAEPDGEVVFSAKNVCSKYGIKLYIIPSGTGHEKMMSLRSKTRVSIGLSMSDGISTSMLEAMATGSYPIQSFTACADEWIINNVSGKLVNPESISEVKNALEKAITNDQLVDNASKLNMITIRRRAEYFQIQNKVSTIYNSILSDPK